MRVARQVGQHRLRPGEGPLGIDHPLAPTQWLDGGGAALQLDGISSAGIGAAGARSANGRNDGGALGIGFSPTGAGPPRSAVGAREGLASASITHSRTMFAFRPLANATAAIDTPGFRHACATCSLNSGACRRRVRLLGNSIPEVSMCPRCSDADTSILGPPRCRKMTSPDGYPASSGFSWGNERGALDATPACWRSCWSTRMA